MKKKQWSKPRLILLVKSTSEEWVLVNCKGGTSGGSAVAAANCIARSASTCTQCSTFGS